MVSATASTSSSCLDSCLWCIVNLSAGIRPFLPLFLLLMAFATVAGKQAGQRMQEATLLFLFLLLFCGLDSPWPCTCVAHSLTPNLKHLEKPRHLCRGVSHSPGSLLWAAMRVLIALCSIWSNTYVESHDLVFFGPVLFTGKEAPTLLF